MFQVKQGENDDDNAEPPLPQLNILPSDDENEENHNADVIIKDEATDSGWENIFGDVFVTKIETCEDRVKTEFINYKQEPSIGFKRNPLDWWNSNSAKFLLLSKLAKLYLCTQATSVASERIFRTAGDIVTWQQASLTPLIPDNVDMFFFLKNNYKDWLLS